MGIWDRFGGGIGMQRNANPSTEESDEQAIARYRYMLKTALPETIEQAHAEAFAALTPEQRRKVLQQLRDEMPEAERMSYFFNDGIHPNQKGSELIADSASLFLGEKIKAGKS